MSTGLDFIDAFFGCQLAGAVPVSLAADQHGSAHRVAHIATRTELALVVAGAAGEGIPPGVRQISALALRGHDPIETPRNHDTAFVQFTSGSTRSPRGVVISQRAACTNSWAIANALESGDDDVLVAWLPLSHDMGLIGTLLAPLVSGARMVLMSPEYFISDAGRRFLRLVTTYRGTVWVMPPFAYRLLARRGPPASGEVRLDSVRVALVGAEMISADVIDGFVRAFAPCGFSRGALTTAYGLAEATLGVSFGVLGAGPTFAKNGYASLGRPIAGLQARVRLQDADAAAGEVGEIELRGESLMSGYENDPEATAACLVDGWLRTGDLGFQQDGELFMCGRAKDLIKRAGRSYFGTDIETAMMRVEGTNAAAVLAVQGRDGTETAVALVEHRQWNRDPDGALARLLMAAAHEHVGLTLERVALVRPWSLPRTTSGKLRLPACHELWLQRDVTDAAHR
jgi:acyl-CoA synthetase (AMP-forming)/AMP-acid ligase II